MGAHLTFGREFKESNPAYFTNNFDMTSEQLIVVTITAVIAATVRELFTLAKWIIAKLAPKAGKKVTPIILSNIFLVLLIVQIIFFGVLVFTFSWKNFGSAVATKSDVRGAIFTGLLVLLQWLRVESALGMYARHEGRWRIFAPWKIPIEPNKSRLDNQP